MTEPNILPTPIYGGMSLSSISILNTSDDWTRWNREIRDYLIFSGYSTLLEAENADQTAMQSRARAAIRNRCGYNAYTTIEETSTVFEMFKLLKEDFKPSGPGTFALLCQQFQEPTLADCKDVTDYVEKFRRIQHELNHLESTLVFPAPFLVQKFLHGLGPAYSIFRTTFNQTRNILPEGDKPAVTLDVTTRAAIVEERSMRSDETTSQAFYTRVRPLPNGHPAPAEKVCSICGKKYHDESECWETHPEKKREYERKKDKKRKAHEEQEREKKKQKNNKENKDNNEEPGNQLMFMAQSSSGLDLTKVYPLDSACTQHTIMDRSLFTDYHPIMPSHTIGGICGVSTKPLGYGTIALPMDVNGEKEILLISGVLHSPGVGVNLLSVDQFQNNGVDVRLGVAGFTLQKGSGPLFQTTRHKGFYLMTVWGQILPSGSPSRYALATYGLSDPIMQVWHERMGHLGEGGLQKLERMATGMDLKEPYKDTCTCEECVMGCMKECSYNYPTRPGEYPLNLVHTDLCGPFPVMGDHGEFWWITMLCDKTQVSEVMPLKSKKEAPEAFKQYLLRNEHPERRCRRIRLAESRANSTWIDFDECMLLSSADILDTSMSDRTPNHLQRKTQRLRV